MSARFEEAMRELAVRGTHGAAGALAGALGRRIVTEHIACELTTASALADRLGRTAPASAVALTIVGGSTGSVIVLLPGDSATELGAELTGPGATREMALSAVEEAGNILVSAYLNALARAAGRTLVPSVPRFFHGTVAEILFDLPPGLVVVETRLGAEAGLGETLGHFLHAAPAGALEELLVATSR